ncbi:protein of unknown function [Candidatus Nitrosocosmicus franklandus]|uniref:Uncharacterized protein n=1 Tax=Candidatus Nitrosocosmicus franklandianus TaxID=1798806 RepID=A0A484I5V7_9ARCH|nr:protein of unknown function [Candidatus Nitrosocosmicus franklandus]
MNFIELLAQVRKFILKIYYVLLFLIVGSEAKWNRVNLNQKKYRLLWFTIVITL